MNLSEYFWRSVHRRPNAEALVDHEVRWTYRRLAQEVEAAASFLASQGVGQGDHVVVLLKNRRENVVVYWACQHLGAIYTPINYRMAAGEIAYCLADAEAKLVVAEEALRGVVEQALADSPLAPPVHLVGPAGAWSTQAAPPCPPAAPCAPEDPAIMLYTAGTTGRPKGVPRSHWNEISAALAHIVQNRYAAGEVAVGVMPFYHTMGMRTLLTTAFLNGKLVLMPDYDSAELAQWIASERVSALYLVPTLFYDLLNLPDLDRYDLSALRRIGYAGAAMTGALTQACFERFKPELFVNHFGSSEVYTFTVCSWLDRKPTCAGKAGIHEEVRVVPVGAEGEEALRNLPPGEVGEVVVRLNSPEAFSGYWKRPDANAKALRQGWYFTGDLGMWDEDGDLWVKGRVDDMIISGGENIHPLEVEEVLCRHPGVQEVAVTSSEDPRWGQVVTAFVVRRDPKLTDEDLDRFCRESDALANFKRPRRYVFVREIPKSPVGKILRRQLREGGYQPEE
jgi:2-furoate---CoA ligase